MKTICVDLDGTIADYKKGWRGYDIIEDPIPGSREFLLALKREYLVMIHTTRINMTLAMQNHPKRENVLLSDLIKPVKNWLKAHDMPYDSIWHGLGKPLCLAFVDDRTLGMPQPMHDPSAYGKILDLIEQAVHHE